MAAIIPGDPNASGKAVKQRVKIALGGFTDVSNQKLEYLGRRRWRVPLNDVVLYTTEADSGKKAIEMAREALGLPSTAGLKAVAVE